MIYSHAHFIDIRIKNMSFQITNVRSKKKLKLLLEADPLLRKMLFYESYFENVLLTML